MHRLLLFIMGCGVCGLSLVSFAHSSLAEPGSGIEETPRERLQALDVRKREEAERAQDLQRKVDSITISQETLQSRLVILARRIQDNETRVADAQRRVSDLQYQEAHLEETLSLKHEGLGFLLAALQKIGTVPPPALFMYPDDALDAVRSSMLLEYVLSGLHKESAELRAQLGELINVKQGIQEERSGLLVLTRQLKDEEAELHILIQERQQRLRLMRSALSETQERLEELAREMESLQDLIANVPAGGNRGPSDKGGRVLSGKPTLAFSDTLGKLSFPVRGEILVRFGGVNTPGDTARGIFISALPGAQVTSPVDGWVVYAGPFRSYGRILILNVGEGYHIVLAGLERIDVDVGQFLLMGEPVGVMGDKVLLGQSIYAVGQSDGPVLYVELRKGGNAVDSELWWAGVEGGHG